MSVRAVLYQKISSYVVGELFVMFLNWDCIDDVLFNFIAVLNFCSAIILLFQNLKREYEKVERDHIQKKR